jgi:RNA polymerase sigma-70 factor (ECF subfamily)
MVMGFEERVADKRSQLVAYVVETLHVGGSVAEDVVQEAILTAIAKQSQFQGGDNEGQLVSWLRIIAYRIGLKAIDSQSVSPEGLSQHPDAKRTPSREMRDEEYRAKIRDVIAELPDRQREVITWHFFLNWSIKEIADKLELNEGAVYGLKARGLKRLSEVLSPEQFHTFLG